MIKNWLFFLICGFIIQAVCYVGLGYLYRGSWEPISWVYLGKTIGIIIIMMGAQFLKPEIIEDTEAERGEEKTLNATKYVTAA